MATEVKDNNTTSNLGPTTNLSGPSPRIYIDSSGTTIPVWTHTSRYPKSFSRLDSDLAVDICIVGGGIAGLQTAYELATIGREVALIEDGELLSGETGRTTAHLMSWKDDHYDEIIKTHGLDNARLVADSHRWAIDRIEDICRVENIDCEFRRINGYLIHGMPEDSKDFEDKTVRREFEAVRKVGFEDAQLVPQAPVSGIKTGTALLMPNQGEFQPIKYLNQLTQKLVDRGVKIYTHTHVDSVTGGEKPTAKTSEGHTIRANHIVEATNVPLNRIVIIDKIEPYRSYAIAGFVPKTLEHNLIWDIPDIYHYVRRTSADENQDLLIIGGEDHRVGESQGVEETEKRFRRLEDWAKERFPEYRNSVYWWSGQVWEPVDMLAYIGLNPGDKNVYVITGDSGMGMTHSVIAGRVITNLILGNKHPWNEIYSPNRHPKVISEFLKHNAEVGLHYCRWLQGSDAPDIEDLKPCSGAVFSKRLPVPEHTAVYKDENGQVHAFTAVCPHMKGIVNWNPLEKSWDCPVHGSRFDRYGKVINGPASSHLEPKKL